MCEWKRHIDLLSYQADEPSNFVEVKGTTNVYCTVEHDKRQMVLVVEDFGLPYGFMYYHSHQKTLPYLAPSESVFLAVAI